MGRGRRRAAKAKAAAKNTPVNASAFRAGPSQRVSFRNGEAEKSTIDIPLGGGHTGRVTLNPPLVISRDDELQLKARIERGTITDALGIAKFLKERGYPVNL